MGGGPEEGGGRGHPEFWRGGGVGPGQTGTDQVGVGGVGAGGVGTETGRVGAGGVGVDRVFGFESSSLMLFSMRQIRTRE